MERDRVVCMCQSQLKRVSRGDRYHERTIEIERINFLHKGQVLTPTTMARQDKKTLFQLGPPGIHQPDRKIRTTNTFCVSCWRKKEKVTFPSCSSFLRVGNCLPLFPPLTRKNRWESHELMRFGRWKRNWRQLQMERVEGNSEREETIVMNQSLSYLKCTVPFVTNLDFTLYWKRNKRVRETGKSLPSCSSQSLFYFKWLCC